jgi:hypothetical protein
VSSSTCPRGAGNGESDDAGEVRQGPGGYSAGNLVAEPSAHLGDERLNNFVNQEKKERRWLGR